MLLSAVSVLGVAQSSSDIPEGLMNNPVYKIDFISFDVVSKDYFSLPKMSETMEIFCLLKKTVFINKVSCHTTTILLLLP